MAEKDDQIAEARKEFERCAEADEHNRETGLEDLNFARGGDHWPANVKKMMEDDGLPVLTINKLPAFLRQVINDARQNSPTIKVSPVDDNADVETAEVIGDLIRNIEYTSDADVAYDTGIDCAASNGFGFWRVVADYSRDDTFDQDLLIKRIRNPFSVYTDPDSQEADSSDWNVAFITERQSKAAFERKWKDKATVSWDDTDAWGGASWRDGETVVTAEWWTREEVEHDILEVGPVRVDGQEPPVEPRIISQEDYESDEFQALVEAGAFEVYRQRKAKTFKVVQRFMSGAEVLEKRDWPGRFIPIIPVWGDEFDIEGKVYHRSLVHDALDAARRYDYWSTKATHLVALAPRVPFIGAKGQFSSDAARWATSNTGNHPYLEYDVVTSEDGGLLAPPPMRQPLDVGPAAGVLQQALQAGDDIKDIMGIHDASLGIRSNETSGKAIMARQREGDVSTFHFSDNQVRAIRHTGRVLIDLLPHFYGAARVVRVRGEDGSERNVTINKRAPKIDSKTRQPVMEQGPDGRQQAVMAMHDLTVGKYDVTVSAGPSYTTRRQEAAEQMMELLRVFPQAAPLIGDLIAKKLDWPGADEIAERLKKMLPPQVMGEDGGLPPQIKQFIEQGKQMIELLQKTVGEKDAEIASLKADKSVDMMNADTNKFEAKTDRMKTMAEIARPQVQAAPAAQ